MSDKELELYLERIDAGLMESRKKLLNEYAMRGDSLVESDDEGNVVHVPAKEILDRHPELRM